MYFKFYTRELGYLKNCFLQFEFVDMHYGTDGGDETNPALLRYHLEEIKCCNNTSKAGYFLVSLRFLLNFITRDMSLWQLSTTF